MQIMTRIARRLLVVSATGALSLVGMGVGAALAQQAQPVQPALAPKAANPALDGWVKVCQVDQAAKKEICQTTYDLRASTGQVLANFTLIEVSGEARKMIRMIVPTGVLLQEGVSIRIDDQKPEQAKFNWCAPDACVSQLVATDAMIASLKKGKQLVLGVSSQAAQPISFPFPLASFNASNAGKPLDEAMLKKRQELLMQEIQQQQTSLEDQLKEAQRKALQGQ